LPNRLIKHKIRTGKETLKGIAKKGFFHLLSANILIQVFGFGSQLLVAWLLSPEQLGQIKIMQTYLGIALLISTFGFNTSTLKLCSEERPEGEIIFLYKRALKYVFFTLVITWPILLMFTHLGIISTDASIKKYFPFFSLLLIPWTFNGIFSNYLQARKEIKLLSRIQTGTKLISLVLLIGFTILFSFKGYLISMVLGYSITFLFFRRSISSLHGLIEIKKIGNPFKIHWRYANISFLTNLLGQLGLQIDIFLMNYFITDRIEIGFYSFGLTMALVTRIFSSAVMQIVMPFMSEKSIEKNSLKNAYNKYNRINAISSLLIAGICFILIPILVELIFGDKYLSSIPFFRVFMIAWFFQSIYTIKGYTLFGIGKINYNLYSSIILLILGIIISFSLMQEFGILGLAYGKVAVNIVAIAVVSILFKRGMKLYEKK
jgi:O-antigen/teichoic acid export membrane protein